MQIFETKNDLQGYLSKISRQKLSIGFVPTMGALHEGHISLIKKATNKNDITVVSIFVNPTQFNNHEDLVKYPKTLKNDISLLENVHCDVLFLPSVDEIYGTDVSSDSFNFDGLEHQMEGKFREGHFNGVATVVKTFFEIVKPNKAYFGQKDFQQLQIIKKMVENYKIPVSIKACPIYREADGLAMSSRNTRLTEEHRKAAPFIYKTLQKIKKKFDRETAKDIIDWVEKEFKKHPLLDLEYFTIADEKPLRTIHKKEANEKYRAFIAVFAGEIRLIDNLQLKN